ncbi:MAG TPA: HAD family phosphatase [Cytophagales bacterium]|nr:HAD family phosphatase [Cytophagales bacterium]
MSLSEKRAAIFDMDGVLVVNMKFHEEAFYEFGRRRGVEITPEFFFKNITGSTNERIMPRIFGDHISAEDIKSMSEEKEYIYREMYLPHLRATEGLYPYLDFLKSERIGMAIASNAPMENIKFVADALGLDKYFSHMLNGLSVANPKPAPDMFLRCAELLGAAPHRSVVFEDAPGGIRGTHEAGMRAVALLTSHSKEELIDAHLYVNDFTDARLYDLWK